MYLAALPTFNYVRGTLEAFALVILALVIQSGIRYKDLTGEATVSESSGPELEL